MEILFVLFLTAMWIEARASIGRAFLCRDPDTGKLHTINSTWPSSTFCGNYHCRLRKQITANNEQDVLRQIKLTGNDLGNKSSTPNKGSLNSIFNDYELFKKIYNYNAVDTKDVTVNKGGENLTPTNTVDSNTDADRYLTADEIRAISTILRGIKKSDLDAIVELYHVAQSIYDEFEKSNLTGLMQDTINDVSQDIKKSNILNSEEVKHNYWYDPLPTNKHPRVHLLVHHSTQGTDNMSMRKTTPKYRKPMVPPLAYSYFNGTLTNNDFGSVPYYTKTTVTRPAYQHPPLVVSKTPYRHPKPNLRKNENDQLAKQKFRKPENDQQAKQNFRKPEDKVPPKPNFRKNENNQHKYKTNNLKPSSFLPYPISYTRHYYNWTNPQPLYQVKNYIERYEANKKAVLGTDNATLINPFLEKIYGVEKKPAMENQRLKIKMSLGKSKQLVFNRDWDMNPLTGMVLEEVKPQVKPLVKRSKKTPNPLKQKQKLDKILDKMIAINDIIKRKKRSVGQETLEPYLDRITCKSDTTVPGFFRFGNLSQPYPACCPQRI